MFDITVTLILQLLHKAREPAPALPGRALEARSELLCCQVSDAGLRSFCRCRAGGSCAAGSPARGSCRTSSSTLCACLRWTFVTAHLPMLLIFGQTSSCPPGFRRQCHVLQARWASPNGPPELSRQSCCTCQVSTGLHQQLSVSSLAFVRAVHCIRDVPFENRIRASHLCLLIRQRRTAWPRQASQAATERCLGAQQSTKCCMRCWWSCAALGVSRSHTRTTVAAVWPAPKRYPDGTDC